MAKALLFRSSDLQGALEIGRIPDLQRGKLWNWRRERFELFLHKTQRSEMQIRFDRPTMVQIFAIDNAEIHGSGTFARARADAANPGRFSRTSQTTFASKSTFTGGASRPVRASGDHPNVQPPVLGAHRRILLRCGRMDLALQPLRLYRRLRVYLF